MKTIVLIIFTLLLVVNLMAEDNASMELKYKMLDKIEEQSKTKQYVRLKGIPVVYFKDFVKFPEEKKWEFAGAYVYIEGKVRNATYTDYGGVRAIIDEYGCGFYNRYYENLKELESEEKVAHAICKLPRFNSCIPVLEGIDNYY